ncbi:hypothetical protein STEG23_038149, partial [Scotinomys teguina]
TSFLKVSLLDVFALRNLSGTIIFDLSFPRGPEEPSGLLHCRELKFLGKPGRSDSKWKRQLHEDMGNLSPLFRSQQRTSDYDHTENRGKKSRESAKRQNACLLCKSDNPSLIPETSTLPQDPQVPGRPSPAGYGSPLERNHGSAPEVPLKSQVLLAQRLDKA